MGIYDRDYSRDSEPGFQLSAPTTATMQLMVVTGLVYLAQLAFPFVNENFSLQADWFLRPWTYYQLLTYGFLHSPNDIAHILINMLVLFMFGREVEARYGKREFLLFYLVGIVAAGTVWSISEYAAGMRSPEFAQMAQMGVAVPTPTAVGASGALAALVVLFAFNWPHRQVLLFFIIPMPMWVAAALGILFDVKGAIDRSGNIAFACHLGGALYGLAYYKLGWRLSQFWPSNLAMPKIPGTGPKLRVHDPEGDDAEDDLGQQVDRILEKIQQQGQDSLTWKERRTLERASKQYQEKRK